MLGKNRFIDEKLSVSITSLVRPDNPVDSISPLSFQDWLKYNNALFTNAEDFLYRYQSYLNNWYEVKNLQKPVRESITKSLYTLLINEIVLSFTTSDEKRFLKNIDFNNKRDLAVAVPFFAKKIKDICIYYSTLRDDVKTSIVKYNLKGSIYGTESLIYNQISKSLETEDLTELISSLSLSLSDIRNNMVIDIEELFDEYTNYYDISPNLPASAYNATDERSEYFITNQYEIDPKLFLSFDSSIIDAITAYPFYLVELGTNNFFINYNIINSNSLEFLKDKDYINTVNTQTKSNLNLNLELGEIVKYMGNDFYYLSTNSTGTEYLTGRLFSAESAFANYLNKRYPSVAAIPSNTFTRSAKEIGLFFKPDKIGLSNFYSFGTSLTVNKLRLSADTVYVFPDPNQFGNISGLSKEEFDNPIIYNDLSYFIKTDFSNQYKFGDPVSSPYFQTFRAYQTREQSLNYSLQGLSRYTDPQDFFNGYEKNVWSNKDIFPIVPQNVFPIDSRVEKLYSLNKTATQFKTDIYGNDYFLYKDVHPSKNLSNTPVDNSDKKIYYALTIDGHVFFDPVSGFNFDYTLYNPLKNYTGILLKTTTNIPPGSGWYNQGPDYLTPTSLSAIYYNNGAPDFSLEGASVSPIVSYRFQPETFDSKKVLPEFVCSVADGVTFTSSGSGDLPDISTDDPSYNPETAIVYYGELIDGGVNPQGPDFRANFVFPGIFTFTPPYSAYKSLDGFIFAYEGLSPCGGDIIFAPTYTEKSNYLNYRIPLRDTKVIESISSLSAKRSLYQTNFIDYGQAYYRNSNSSIIMPVSSALSAMLIKYNNDIYNEINDNLINFDIISDTIIFETENYFIADKILFDYETNTNISITKNDSYIKRRNYKDLEKISTLWYNEDDNIVLVCKTVLYPELSATNYKIIYPEIYVLNLDSLAFNKIYPQIDDNQLDFNKLKMFSLSGTSLEVNIISIDKPLFNYNNETGLYTITWLGKDIANCFYIYKTFFKYINGVITNISNSMFKLLPDVNDINFSNSLPKYSSINISGSASSILNGAYSF